MSTPLISPTAGGPRLAGMLSLAWDRASAFLDAELAPRHPALRPAHLQVFRFGSIEGRRVTELASTARMSKQSMHELVTHFERHGYLHREIDPTDERARLIRLTDAGRALEADVVAASARLHLQWHETLGDELFSALWVALQRLTGQPGECPDLDGLRRLAASG